MSRLPSHRPWRNDILEMPRYVAASLSDIALGVIDKSDNLHLLYFESGISDRIMLYFVILNRVNNAY